MKIVGLITEYNPFHNGHLYHIRKAKEITGADYVIVVMSGNFVQRGAPAIMPKHIRAEVALAAGVPLVLELPVCFAAGSAEYFAQGAVSLLGSLGCVDSICFGSECGDFALLEKIARVTADEPEEYKLLLKEYMAKGHSFPSARQQALEKYLGENVREILEQPNNILGIEYIKALCKTHSSMKAYTIKRIVSDYHEDSLNGGYSSASAIRKLLAHAGRSLRLEEDGMFDEPGLSEVLARLETEVPAECIRFLEETHYTRYPIYENDFSAILKYRLLTETRETLTEYVDVNTEIANRILNHLNQFITIDQFCNLLKTKDTTYARVSRCLFHILLNIKDADMELFQKSGYAQYARVLGFRKDGRKLLSVIKKQSSIPLVTKLLRQEALSDAGQRMMEQDIFAANLYESIVTDKYKQPFLNEYKQQVVRV